MSSDSLSADFLKLIASARSGDDKALGIILEKFRNQLHVLADQEIGGKLNSRVDASDLVQQTLLSACRKLEHFQGASEREFAAWIFQIHRRNIKDVIRKQLLAEKRNLRKEQVLHESGLSSTQHENTPDQNFIKSEQANSLFEMLQQLPEEQKLAVQMRYLEDLTLEEIACNLHRSTQAAASMLKRGLEKLREFSRQRPESNQL